MQPLGGPPEVQFGGYCHERFELTQLHILTVPRQAGSRSDQVCLAARLFGLAEECVRKLPLFRLRARCQARTMRSKPMILAALLLVAFLELAAIAVDQLIPDPTL